jgi:hypothetical protein
VFNDAVLIHSQAAQLPAVVTDDPVNYNFLSGTTFSSGDVFYVGYEHLAAASFRSVATRPAARKVGWLGPAQTPPPLEPSPLFRALAPDLPRIS